MKKQIAIVSLLALSISLSACGTKTETMADDEASDSSNQSIGVSVQDISESQSIGVEVQPAK